VRDVGDSVAEHASGTAVSLGRDGGFASVKQLGSSQQGPFVEQAADVAMARHAAGTGAARLRDSADRLRVVFSDGIANFGLGHIQTMAERPRSVGITRMLNGCLFTEVHGCDLSAINRGGD
jgi:hypothetical protein